MSLSGHDVSEPANPLLDAVTQAGSLTCPECGEKAVDAMRLGLHRKRAHGVAGKHAGEKRKGPARDRAPRAGGGGEKRAGSLKSEIRQGFKAVGTIVGVGDPYCGGILRDHCGPFADALGQLAATDPAFARWLRRGSRFAPYLGLVLGAATMVFPIVAHHGAPVSPGVLLLMGVPLPPVSESPGDGQVTPGNRDPLHPSHYGP